MQQHRRYALKLFGERMFFNLISLIMIPIFAPIIGFFSDSSTFSKDGVLLEAGSFFGAGSVIYSLMICSLYVGIAFDMIWKMGRHDRQSYATEKHYPLKGLVVALLSEVPFLIFYLLLLLFPQLVSAYRVLCIGPYMGFLPVPTAGGLDGWALAGYGLVLLIMPLFSMLAYMAGYKKPKEARQKLSHKIMYKKKGE